MTLIRLAAPLFLLLAATLSHAQESFVINLRGAQIQELAEQVSEITGRTLILDPSVRGEVTVISSEPLDADAVWDLFQAVLRVQGYAALRTGEIWRISPQAGVTPGGASLLRGGGQDYVTELIRLRNLASDAAVAALRPLVAQFGFIEALSQPNAIIVTDTAENVAQIEALARELDRGDGGQVETIRLRFAGAAEIAQAIERVFGDEALGGAGLGVQIASDERSNVLLVRGDPLQIDEIRRLVAVLDRAETLAAPTTRVFRLRNSDAEPLAEILRGLLGQGAAVSNPVARSLGRQRVPTIGAGPTGLEDDRGLSPLAARTLGIDRRLVADDNVEVDIDVGAAPLADGVGVGVGGAGPADIVIQASAELNAIVVRGPPAAIAEVGALIQELDQRRPQVQIEAAIVEITGNIAEQLGVQFGVGQDVGFEGSFGATSFPVTGPSLARILSVLGAPAALAVASQGLTVGLGFDGFSILIQALAQSSRANLLSTPSITTLDNQPAEIVVAQNVPFVTGTFSLDGTSTDPFTTIEREDVGITLRVLPRVYEGDVVRLEISQEASSLSPSTGLGAVDLITDRRSIQTTVLADNGGTVVLGGLITDDRVSTESKVPVLGDIPVVGRLFRSDTETGSKRTLFVFLRPTILRSRFDVEAATERPYARLRALDAAPERRGSLLFEREAPRLPLEINGLY